MDDEPATPAQVARSRVAALAEEFERREMARAAAPDDFGDDTDHRPRFRLALEAGHVRVLGAILAVAVVAVVWWTGRDGSTASHDAAPPAVAVDEPTHTGEVVVHVGGEVAEPGIVTLPTGSRVVDAVEAAGGAKDESDLSSLNLARPVNDGEQILVGADSAPGDGTAGPSGDGGSKGADGLVSLNQASVEQLQSLPGVGPVTAEAIVRWRDENGGFAHIEDLLNVRGIGEARLAELRDLVSL